MKKANEVLNEVLNEGLNIPIIRLGSLSAKDVINAHIEKLEDAEKVWFSTHINATPKRAGNVDRLLLSNQNGLRYIATVVDYMHFEEKGLPSDVEEYCPEFCNNVAEPHWFLLDSIEPISPDEVEKFSMSNKDLQEKFGNAENHIRNTGRLNNFYFL